MEFANKEYFLLLLLLIPYLVWYFQFRKKSEPTMTLSDTWLLKDAPKTLRQRLVWIPMALRCMTLALLVIVLCRPQTRNAKSTYEVMREIESDFSQCLKETYSFKPLSSISLRIGSTSNLLECDPKIRAKVLEVLALDVTVKNLRLE